MAAYGIPEIDIARVVGVDPKTLRKHYRDELDMGETKANAQVAGFLFNSARSGNVTAQIFWLKTRARWRETPVELRHSGSVSTRDIHDYSDEELMNIIRSAASDLGVTPLQAITRGMRRPTNRTIRSFLGCADASRTPAESTRHGNGHP